MRFSGTAGLGSATLGTTTAFEGNILALTSITLNTGATIYNGRALARNGAVTLDTNIISDICPPESSSPNNGPGFSLGGLGRIAWEKRDVGGTPLGGAQFTITPDPTDGLGILTILDNGPGDADPAVGQILVNNVLLGTYTITETAAPLGCVIDADPTRVLSVTLTELTPVIGTQGTNDTGVTDESDFHNSVIPVSVGSIAWEKRDAGGALLAGAQFTITPDPTDGLGILTILDNGPGDADPAVGRILVKKETRHPFPASQRRRSRCWGAGKGGGGRRSLCSGEREVPPGKPGASQSPSLRAFRKVTIKAADNST